LEIIFHNLCQVLFFLSRSAAYYYFYKKSTQE